MLYYIVQHVETNAFLPDTLSESYADCADSFQLQYPESSKLWGPYDEKIYKISLVKLKAPNFFDILFSRKFN